jgi:putative ABC transport system ATP-binding protein
MINGTALKINNLTRTVGKKTIVDSISYEFNAGRLYTVVGPSGAGKSSLLRLLNRLDEPTGGEVIFDGKPHCDQDPGRLRRQIGFLFQRAYLFPGTVRDNLLFAESDLSDNRMEELLSHAALKPDMLDRTVDNLSGGEAQRVALARMLATEPVICLLDEPTSSLDPTATDKIETSIRRLVNDLGLTVILVTHDPEQALRLNGDTLLMVAGRLVEHGPSKDVLTNPQSEEGRRYKAKELG